MDIHIADPFVEWEKDNLISWSASKPLWGKTIPFIDEHKIAWPQEDPQTPKAWDISGHGWMALGRSVGQQCEYSPNLEEDGIWTMGLQFGTVEFSSNNNLGVSSYPTSSVPFLFPIL